MDLTNGNRQRYALSPFHTLSFTLSLYLSVYSQLSLLPNHFWNLCHAVISNECAMPRIFVQSPYEEIYKCNKSTYNMHVESAQLLRFGQRGIMCSTLVQLSLVRCGWYKGKREERGRELCAGTVGLCVVKRADNGSGNVSCWLNKEKPFDKKKNEK